MPSSFYAHGHLNETNWASRSVKTTPYLMLTIHQTWKVNPVKYKIKTCKKSEYQEERPLAM